MKIGDCIEHGYLTHVVGHLDQDAYDLEVCVACSPGNYWRPRLPANLRPFPTCLWCAAAPTCPYCVGAKEKP